MGFEGRHCSQSNLFSVFRSLLKIINFIIVLQDVGTRCMDRTAGNYVSVATGRYAIIKLDFVVATLAGLGLCKYSKRKY